METFLIDGHIVKNVLIVFRGKQNRYKFEAV